MQEKKRALGKGLEQLFNNETIDFDSFEANIIESASPNDIKEIPLDELRSNPYQPRKNFDVEALEELASSIREYGVFQPIIAKKSIKGYEIVAGERRVRASKLAGQKTIPAIIREFSDNEMREIALLENLQRENLSAIEEAWAYQSLIESLHIRQEDLAEKLGKSRSHITNMLGLLRLPESVQEMILKHEISMGHARVLSKLEDVEVIKLYANRIKEENLSVRELEKMLANPNEIKRKVPIQRKVNTNQYKYIEDALKEKLGTKLRIQNQKIEIYFKDLEDLNRILEELNVEIDI